MDNRRVLFSGSDLSDMLGANKSDLHHFVDRIPPDRLVGCSFDELVEYVVARYSIEPLALDRGLVTHDNQECVVAITDYGRRIEVPGFRITVSLPYVGNPQLWECCPRNRSSVKPIAAVRFPGADGAGCLDVILETPHDRDHSKTKSELSRELDLIDQYLTWQRGQLDAYNAELPPLARAIIEDRRSRLRKGASLSEALEIPLRKRDDAPDLTPIRLDRRSVATLPESSESSPSPEPGITESDYEEILRIIRHEGRSFETAPRTFSKFSEEELRDVLLAHLNGYFEGGATGETFRKHGKTDIRIEDKDRSAFVGECKVWRGPTEIREAVGQILGYVTWRDCKDALVVFNKHNAGFTELVEKLPEVLRSHPLIRRWEETAEAGEWRFVFSSPEDEAREIRLHVFLFNLFTGKR